jgi:hypothetical protein
VGRATNAERHVAMAISVAVVTVNSVVAARAIVVAATVSVVVVATVGHATTTVH